MPSPTDMTPPAVAEMIGCSPPTVRSLIEDGLLPAVAIKKAKKTYYTVSRTDVEAYLREYGPFAKRQPQRSRGQSSSSSGSRAEHHSLVEEIRLLREVVEGRAAPSPDAQAEVVALRETLQVQRAAMAALLEADDDRSAGVRSLQEAMRCFESADEKRKRAIGLLDDAIGSLTLPGTIAGLTD